MNWLDWVENHGFRAFKPVNFPMGDSYLQCKTTSYVTVGVHFKYWDETRSDERVKAVFKVEKKSINIHLTKSTKNQIEMKNFQGAYYVFLFNNRKLFYINDEFYVH